MGAALPDQDTLLAERNAAVAEAAMWLRRMIRMQQERDQALADVRAYAKNLGEWQEAYDELHRVHLRMSLKLDHELFIRDYYESLLRYLDPFLPRWLQDEKQRAANEEIYANLADHRRDDAMDARPPI
jgi:hypothetical protein